MLPVISGEECVKALERLGFERGTQRGSHLKLRNPKTGRVAIVPMHKELALGTLRHIVKSQACVTVARFEAALAGETSE